MPENDYDTQQNEVHQCLRVIEKKMIECLTLALAELFEHTNTAGIAPELVASVIHDYAAALPQTLAPIKIEVLLDTLPPKEKRH